MKTFCHINVGPVVAWWSNRAILAGVAIALSAGSLPGQEPAPGRVTRSAEFQSCKTNLNRLFDAIQEYRKSHGTWPDLLTDLHPEYISDLNQFSCPENLRRGGSGLGARGIRSAPWVGPLPKDYGYEFTTNSYPLWAGVASTEREYKLRQMKVVGSNVPIVRCISHGPEPNLFLSVGGNIFEQYGMDWEFLFTNDQVQIEQLLPPAAFSDLAPLPGRFTDGIIPRDPTVSPNLIDLSRHYTSDLRTPWLWRNDGLSLSNILRGSIQLRGVPVRFDVRGVIQLTSRNMKSPFPGRAPEIVVARKGRFLHFLEGAVLGRKRSADAHGNAIGRYEVRYADGRSLDIPIHYGQDVLAWDDAGDGANARGAKVAWQGTNGTNEIRLYHQRWQNRWPNTEIATLDFVSNMAEAAPFLIAVTLEP